MGKVIEERRKFSDGRFQRLRESLIQAEEICETRHAYTRPGHSEGEKQANLATSTFLSFRFVTVTGKAIGVAIIET